ncbi:lymphocyte antigen 6K isoform X2 [Hylobates moloch]|uniref:lymphocyte antigen 6K isoform X2 n=1 Tax=Hylobates moloch TaxID=81572 RepID=UPI0026765274|nr:lymphocyte antigen 6K isoform X2 [Hylobates moloch]
MRGAPVLFSGENPLPGLWPLSVGCGVPKETALGLGAAFPNAPFPGLPCPLLPGRRPLQHQHKAGLRTGIQGRQWPRGSERGSKDADRPRRVGGARPGGRRGSPYRPDPGNGARRLRRFQKGREGASRADPQRAPLATMALLAFLLVVALPRVWTDANLTARQRDPEDAKQTDEGDNRLWCHVCERENTFECQNPRRCKETEPYCVIAAVTTPRPAFPVRMDRPYHEEASPSLKQHSTHRTGPRPPDSHLVPQLSVHL